MPKEKSIEKTKSVTEIKNGASRSNKRKKFIRLPSTQTIRTRATL